MYNRPNNVTRLKTKKYYEKAIKIIVASLLLLGSLAGVLAWQYFATLYGSTNSGFMLDLDPNSKGKIISVGTSLYAYCDVDGVRVFDLDNNTIYSNTYTMLSPTVVSKNKAFAVFELLGRTIKVYDESGIMHTVETSNPISKIALNENGYVCAITNLYDEYKTEVFTNKGDRVLTRIDHAADGYPIAADISSDNKMLAISYVDTSGVNVDSKVVYFYVHKVDSNDYPDSILSGINASGVIIPKVIFTKNNRLLAVSDKKLMFLDDKSELLWEYELTNEIERIGINNNNILIVYGNALTPFDSKDAGTVEAVNFNGKHVSYALLDTPITYFNDSNSNRTIVASLNKFYALNENCNILWEKNIKSDVSDVLVTKSINEILVVTKFSAEIESLKNVAVPTENTGNTENDDITENIENIDITESTENIEMTENIESTENIEDLTDA